MKTNFLQNVFFGSALCCSLNDTSVSVEARRVADLGGAIYSDFERSEILFGARNQAISDLCNLLEEAGKANWDGYGAKAITRDTAAMVLAFINSLPHGYPLPEFAAEPDGSISLDWIRDAHHMFSMSVGVNNRFSCAWIAGSDKGHCVARFDGQHIPTIILLGIQQAVGNNDIGKQRSV